MAPISIEAKFSNPNQDFKRLIVNSQELRYDIGDRKIEVTGFANGGEAIISRKNLNSKTSKIPDTISLKKDGYKETNFNFVGKGGKEDRVTLVFRGK